VKKRPHDLNSPGPCIAWEHHHHCGKAVDRKPTIQLTITWLTTILLNTLSPVACQVLASF